jgi:hypothetical protein
MSSSVRTRNIKNNYASGGYFISYILTKRLNVGCTILEVPTLREDLVEHKVILTDGVTPTIGIVIRRGYIFFLNGMPVYYTPGARIYILNDKYQQYALPAIYSRYTKTLTDVLYYIRQIKGASLDISMSFNEDYAALAGTPEANDALEAKFVRSLAEAMGIEPNRIVITGINPGSVIVKFTVIESLDKNAPTPVDTGEELKFQLSRKDSKLYTDEFFKTAKSIRLDVEIKDLSVTDPSYLFLRDYNINIYEKIVNDEIDVLGDIFEFLDITIE